MEQFRFLARWSFWGAAAFALFEALIPSAKAIQLFPWDKAEHFTAFYILALLATAGYPSCPLPVILIGLLGFGGLIEALQADPLFGRDADFWDWAADAAGLSAAALPILAMMLRRTRGEPPRAVSIDDQ